MRKDSHVFTTIGLNEGHTRMVERQNCLLQIFEWNISMAGFFFVWEELNIAKNFITSQSPSIPARELSSKTWLQVDSKTSPMPQVD